LVVASAVMLLGYSIIAVPTGIITAELGQAARRQAPQDCPSCQEREHLARARYCHRCGAQLTPTTQSSRSIT
jgi:voltage-gated potassium channel